MGHQSRKKNESATLLPTYQIQGSRQVPYYCKFLKGASNKASLANYISLYILEHTTEYIPNGKSIILAGGFSEGMPVKEATPSGVSSIERLYSNQEEADTRMILHASSLSRDHERIIIQCDDTHVLVLLVYYFSRGHLTDHVYMFAGHSGEERYIPVHRIANEIGQTVCECLPAAHALSGCDTTCSMNKIGKKTAYSKLLINVDTLSNLKTFHEDDLEDRAPLLTAIHYFYTERREVTWTRLTSCATSWLRQQTSPHPCFPRRRIPSNSTSFEQNTKHGFGACFSHMPNEEVIEPVGHGLSACDDGGIT